jgi:hypothetical protein
MVIQVLLVTPFRWVHNTPRFESTKNLGHGNNYVANDKDGWNLQQHPQISQ